MKKLYLFLSLMLLIIIIACAGSGGHYVTTGTDYDVVEYNTWDATQLTGTNQDGVKTQSDIFYYRYTTASSDYVYQPDPTNNPMTAHWDYAANNGNGAATVVLSAGGSNYDHNIIAYNFTYEIVDGDVPPDSVGWVDNINTGTATPGLWSIYDCTIKVTVTVVYDGGDDASASTLIKFIHKVPDILLPI